LAEQIDGVLALQEITPSWCTPGNPNGKARLERWFGTLDGQLCKSFPSYCGKYPDDRPEAHAKLVAKAVPWETFVTKLGEYVKAYNNRPHSAEDMRRLTPLQVLRLATRKRVLDENLCPFLLAAWHRPVSIGRNGVSIEICGTTIRYGADHPAITALPIGTQVRVSYDPEDIRRIHVWTMSYTHVCEAEANRKMNRSVTTEALRDEMRKIAAEKRTLRKAMKVDTCHLNNPVDRAIASLNADSARRRLPDPPGPDGGPVLIPVRTPIEAVPQKQIQRIAAGAEGMDAQPRLRDLLAKQPTEPQRQDDAALLRRLARGPAGR
jgi:hypothetical protein